jgi:signal transduction histidine kinase/CheY-like chemotaxis protein
MEAANKTFPAFLSGGGEMGERIRNFDWNTTPLGDPVEWEESLKTCVRIMLSSTQPIWIGWGKDLIKLYNDPYKAIVGGKHPHALGKPASEVWEDIWHDIEPLLKQAMEKDKGTYVESQLLIMERYGYPEETYYTFSYTPVLGNDLRPAGIICYNTADTDRIINERALKTLRQLDILAQKRSEQEVYEQAALAIAGNNRDFPFATFYKVENDGNMATLVAYAGFKIKETEHPEKIDFKKNGDNFKNIATAINQNKIVLSKNNGRWKTLPKGSWDIMPDSFVHVPIKTASNKFPLAILTLGLNPYRKFDDTYRNFVQQIADQVTLSINNVRAYDEERKRNEALEELDKAKTIFFTNISHELRTPLTLMLGTIEEAIHDPNTIPANTRRLNMAHRNALRLLKLVNNLLDFSLIESGRQKAHYVATNVEILTKNLAASFRSALEKAGLEFIINTDCVSQPLYIDKQMWEKIVFNLLSNAFKYTLTGSIELNLFSENSHIVLEIKDTGIGIPEKELPHIFERFHRVQNHGGRTYEGTGIGLSLVKELVQMHGGTISVRSEEGKGTVFTVTIPFGKTHLPETQIFEIDDKPNDLLALDYIDGGNTLGFTISNVETSENNNGQITGKESASVLVVDDNADMRDHLQSLLKQHFTVITAENGKDALDKIKSFTPSLVLSDIMMPVLDGIQLLEKIKNNHETEQIPVILLTARAGEESRIEGYEIGADDYLVKPFSAKELLARVKSQIKIAKTRKHLQTQLREFFMEAPAGIGVVKGNKHIWEIVNKRMLELVGRKSSDELLNKPLFESIPEGSGQGFEAILDNVYLTGQRFVLDEAPAELFRNGKKKSFMLRYYLNHYMKKMAR